MTRQFVVVAVPLFCTISGFFVGNKNSQECVSFAKTHMRPLYTPVLFWSLPFIIYDLYKGYGSIEYNIFRYLCCGYSIHYFIAIMLQFYLIMPFMVKTNVKKQLTVTIVISLFCIAGFSYLMYVQGIDIPLYIYAGTLPVWIMFFSLGIYLSRVKRKYSLFPLFIGNLVFLILSFFESKYYINNFGYINAIGYKVTNFCFSFFFIMILMSEQAETYVNQSINQSLRNFLSWLGKNSLGIYFVHYPLLVFILCHIKTIWFMEFLLSLGISICIIILSKRIFSKKINVSIGFR